MKKKYLFNLFIIFVLLLMGCRTKTNENSKNIKPTVEQIPEKQVHVKQVKLEIPNIPDDMLINKDSTYQISDLIGKYFKKMLKLNSYERTGGCLVGDIAYWDKDNLSITFFNKDSSTYIFLNKGYILNDKHTGFGEVKDVLVINDKQPEERLVFPGRGYIVENKLPNNYIIGIGIPDSNGFIDKFRKAWLIDKNTSKYREVTPSQFTCQLDGY